MAPRKKKINWKVLLLLPIPVLWALAAQLGYLVTFDNWLIDRRFRFRGEIETEARVVYVDIDSKSISELGNFPWPRSYFAQVSDKLINAGGAKAVAIDVVFSEQGVSASYDITKWVTANNELRKFLLKNPPVVVATSYAADQYRDSATGQLVTLDLPLLSTACRRWRKFRPPNCPSSISVGISCGIPRGSA